jgi:hypothetical protein
MGGQLLGRLSYSNNIASASHRTRRCLKLPRKIGCRINGHPQAGWKFIQALDRAPSALYVYVLAEGHYMTSQALPGQSKPRRKWERPAIAVLAFRDARFGAGSFTDHAALVNAMISA